MADDLKGIFEMLWDCPYCDTRGLLGQSHRHCPKCGAPQDPKRRYFPPEGQETAARNTEYVGADRTCPACSSPCSASALYCPNCGSPLEGAREVARVALTPPLPAPPPAKRSGCLKWFLLLAGLGIAAVIALIALGSWKKPATLTVQGHSWRREVAVERLEAVSESAWCDVLPRGAYQVRKSREVRSTRKIPDGQDCRTVSHDRGDGTFERREECTTRYREEDVHDQRCRFQIDRWKSSRKALLEGRSLNDLPAWPALGLPAIGCAERGCEREGGRSEKFVVKLADAAGKSYECEVDERAWKLFPVGTVRQARVGVVTGSVDCRAVLAPLGVDLPPLRTLR